MMPSEHECCAKCRGQIDQRADCSTKCKSCMRRADSGWKTVDIVRRDEDVAVVDAEDERCAQRGQEQPECQPHVSRPQQTHGEKWHENENEIGEEALLRG